MQSGSVPAATNTPASTADAVARAEFELGVRFLEEHKYLGAVDAFQRAIEAAPKFAEAHLNRAVALVHLADESTTTSIRLQRFQEAAVHLETATQLKPGLAVAYRVWAETLRMTGDLPLEPAARLACYRGAVEKYQETTKLDPKDWLAWRDWADLLMSRLAGFARDEAALLQLYKEAGDLLDKAAAHAGYSTDLAPVLARRAEALVEQAAHTPDPAAAAELLRAASHQYHRSTETFARAPAAYAGWGRALVALARITRLSSDLRQGIEKLKRSVELDDTQPEVSYRLACAYAQNQDILPAVQVLARCFELDESGRYLAQAATENDLAVLHGYPEFEAMMRKARAVQEARPAGLNR